jgi:hypothetical protein
MSSQVLLTPQVITRESLVILENNLVAASRVNRKFENKFVKIGASLTIRKPNRFTVASGASLQLQDIAEPSVSITVDKQRHVDFQFTSQDLSLTVEEFNSRYLTPAMAPLANQVDFDCLGNWSDISNYVGVPGVTPATFSSSVQLIGRRMDDNATPQDGRTLVVNPAAHWALAGGLVGSFVMPTAKEALVKGYLSTIGNYDIYMDQNIQGGNSGQHNTSIGMVITSAGNGTGNTTSMFGGTATETISIGEVFTVAGVFNINPQSRQSTGVLKTFVTTASTTPTTSTWTITFSPPIVTSGPYQNVTGPMSTASAITWLTGTTTAQIAGTQNLAFCRDAFGLVMVPLEIPGGVDFAARETYRNISMRTVRAYDINNDVFPTRIDILYGDATYYDELAVRLGG